MAISSYKSFLMTSTNSGSTWSKLIDIKEFPDLGGAPEMLDTTTLSDGARTYIPGIQETEAMSFTCNYTKSDFSALNALKGSEGDYAVWFGGTVSGGVATPDGTAGKFSFKGYLDVFVSGGGVNEVVDMTVTIAPSTVITFA